MQVTLTTIKALNSMLSQDNMTRTRASQANDTATARIMNPRLLKVGSVAKRPEITTNTQKILIPTLQLPHGSHSTTEKSHNSSRSNKELNKIKE